MAILTNCKAPVKPGQKDLLGKENLVAWCIVPFDANERTPLERARMLNMLGIGQFAYGSILRIPGMKQTGVF